MKRSKAVHAIAGNSSWLPDYLADSVLSLRPTMFKDLGITHLVFDIDETLVPKKGMVLTDKYRDHILDLRKSGLKIYIGSNATRDLKPMAKSIGATIIPPTRFSFKPFRSYFRLISKNINALPENTAMIGDRILNDVVGANQAGYMTFLVDAVQRRPMWWHKYYVKWVMNHVY